MDNVVDVIFDEYFSLSDRIESDFVGGDDIHASLGKSAFWCVAWCYEPYGWRKQDWNVEIASEEEHVDTVVRVEIRMG